MGLLQSRRPFLARFDSGLPLAAVKPDALDVMNLGQQQAHNTLATTSKPEALGMGYFELWAGGLMGARLEAWSCNNLGQDRNNTFGHPLRIGGFRHGLLQNLGWGFCGGQAKSLLHGQRGRAVGAVVLRPCPVVS